MRRNSSENAEITRTYPLFLLYKLYLSKSLLIFQKFCKLENILEQGKGCGGTENGRIWTTFSSFVSHSLVFVYIWER